MSGQQILLAVGSSFAGPVVHQYVGTSGTETVPAGATTCLIEIVGAGAGGALTLNNANLAGGGGGAYCARTIAVSGGQTMSYVGGTYGNGGTVLNAAAQNATWDSVTGTVTGGTVNMTTVGAQGAQGAASGGAGGTASGGTTNTPGGAGTTGLAGHGGNGAAPYGANGNTNGTSTVFAPSPSAGGCGYYATQGQGGSYGFVQFTYN